VTVDDFVDRFTVMRSDPFIINPCLWIALLELSDAIRDAHATRVLWETATGLPDAAEAEQRHRRVHRDLVRALGVARSAATTHGDSHNSSQAVHRVEGPSP